jgi:hypothetical protein
VFFEQRPAFFGLPFIDYMHIDDEPTGARLRHSEAKFLIVLARCDHHDNLPRHDVGGERGEPFVFALGPAALNRDIAPLHKISFVVTRITGSVLATVW